MATLKSKNGAEERNKERTEKNAFGTVSSVLHTRICIHICTNARGIKTFNSSKYIHNIMTAHITNMNIWTRKTPFIVKAKWIFTDMKTFCRAKKKTAKLI